MKYWVVWELVEDGSKWKEYPPVKIQDLDQIHEEGALEAYCEITGTRRDVVNSRGNFDFDWGAVVVNGVGDLLGRILVEEMP